MQRFRVILAILVGGGLLFLSDPASPQKGGVSTPPIWVTSEHSQALVWDDPWATPITRAAIVTTTRFPYLSPLDLALLPEEAWVHPAATSFYPLAPGVPRDRSEAWRPLSEEELVEQQVRLTSRAMEYGAELADSLSASYLSDGIRWTEKAMSSTRSTLRSRYRLRLKLSDDQAAFQYKRKY